MKSENKVSIIIPAYNVEGYIEKCLKSIVLQTYKNIEIIIINDGSTDGTPTICDKYAKTDNRIILIHQENKGVSFARNVGIDRATGKYIFFFDADDFIELYAINEIVSIAEDYQSSTVIFGFHQYEDGAIIKSISPIYNKGFYDGDCIIENILSRVIGISYESINQWLDGNNNGLYVENPALWHVLVSRNIINDNKLKFDPTLKIGEDTLFITEYFSCIPNCYVTDKCYYYLVSRESSAIAQYEKNPMAKLDGKEKLLTARLNMTDLIYSKRNIDISQYWEGTVIMSCIELSFLLSKKIKGYKFLQRYKLFTHYVRNKEVERIVASFPLRIKTKLRSIPFILIKMKLYFFLFICTSILNFVNYEFKRG